MNTKRVVHYSVHLALTLLLAFVLGLSGNTTKATTVDGNSVYFPVSYRDAEGAPTIYGVQYYHSFAPEDGVSEHVAVGARWARYWFGWLSVEPENTTPDAYQWQYFDEPVLDAVSQKIHIIFNINANATWAWDPDYHRMDPANFPDFVEFMSAVVERYDGDGLNDAPGSPVIEYFEIFNEPDRLYSPWQDGNDWGRVPDEYADLMKMLYPAIKASNPRANVVMGGLALDWFEDQGGPFSNTFLDDILRECEGFQCFDVVNFHHYPDNDANWVAYGPGLYGKIDYVKQVMQDRGVGLLPIMVTETGWASSDDYGGDRVQKRFVIKQFIHGLAQDVTAVIWFKSDDTYMPKLPGLLDINYQRKPSHYTLEFMISKLKGAVFERVLANEETGSVTVEGYRFRNPDNTVIDILWVQDDNVFVSLDEPGHVIEFQAMQISVYDMDGNKTVLYDGDDGLDGIIRLAIGCDPVFVEHF